MRGGGGEHCATYVVAASNFLRCEAVQHSEHIVRLDVCLLFTIRPHLAQEQLFIRPCTLIALYQLCQECISILLVSLDIQYVQPSVLYTPCDNPLLPGTVAK